MPAEELRALLMPEPEWVGKECDQCVEEEESYLSSAVGSDPREALIWTKKKEGMNKKKGKSH